MFQVTISRSLLTRALFLLLYAWALVQSADFVSAVAERRPDAWLTLATAGVVLVAALISSIAGFAFAALAGGALAFIKLDPVSTVRTILVCSFAIQLYAVWKLRGAIRWKPLWPLLLGGVLTLPIGVWLLLHANTALYAGGLGLLLIAYGSYFLLRREPQASPARWWTAPFAGALGGSTGGLAGLPGVSATIWCSLRGWDKVQQRAVYQPYILVMQVLTMLWLQGQAPRAALASHDFVYVPFALFGAIGGLALFQRLTAMHFQRASSLLLLVSGVGLIAKVV